MITLNSVYQYVGRSNAVKAYGASYNYYILLYAKTEGDKATGKHRVSLKMRLACDGNSSFYNYRTDGSATIAGVSAFSWRNQQIPGSYWGDSASITEEGVTYRRWVDLKEGAVVVDTAYAETEIDLSTSWQRLSISETPPKWLPTTTKATASLSVLLPALEDPEPVEPPEPEEPGEVSYSGISIYADGVLVYDSRLEDYDLIGLKLNKGINVGGTAEIIMPSGHPAYNHFIGHKTIVTIYRGTVLRFRGRALYHTENFYGERTVTCEGELCLLRDGINRPYKYESTPAKIFRHLVREYNEQVETWKQFTIGTVTIPDDSIKLESESAETILATLNKLVERCGGYVVFTTATDGSRAINWLATLNQRSSQTIEFGENLLDFTSTGANTTTLATGIIPYGARLEVTDENGKTTTSKERLTIASVNGGKDYLLAEDAVAVRGTIMTTQTWDDVKEPATLLKKARAYLDSNKVFITSLELTTLDLSYLDKDLDTFSVGDKVKVFSAPHGVNEEFELNQMTEDLLNPAQSRIVLGKDIQSLTREDVAGDFRGHTAVEDAKAKYDEELRQVASQVESDVMEQVEASYASKTELTGYATKTALATHEENARDTYATKKTLSENYATKQALADEVGARAGVINKVDGTVHISGGAPINMLGGKIDINGSEINFGKEIRFLNESGIRIADKNGNFYYVLRVDVSNSCVVGNDYTNLYLRGKDAVYLYKTGAVVTSDRRHKNGIEELPEAYEVMLDKLTPVRFKYNDRGGTYHVGFVAQDVEEALTAAGLDKADFGGFVDLSGNGTELGIAYDEFIGLLLQKIRRLEKRIETMEGKA